MTEIAILVPVLARPHKAEPLARNIAKTTSVPHHVVFICSPDDEDQILACVQADAFILIADWQPGPGDYSKKMNLAYRQTSAPFVFTGADDLDFQPGWAEALLEVAEQTGAGVIGSNDMRNPMVMRGQHATHSLVRRDYIDLEGGTFDGVRGQLFWEGYSHQFCDTELVAAARARDQWAFASDSQVIHDHPFWKHRRDMDATYEKALAHGREDGRLFKARERSFRQAQRRVRA